MMASTQHATIFHGELRPIPLATPGFAVPPCLHRSSRTIGMAFATAMTRPIVMDRPHLRLAIEALSGSHIVTRGNHQGFEHFAFRGYAP